MCELYLLEVIIRIAFFWILFSLFPWYPHTIMPYVMCGNISVLYNMFFMHIGNTYFNLVKTPFFSTYLRPFQYVLSSLNLCPRLILSNSNHKLFRYLCYPILTKNLVSLSCACEKSYILICFCLVIVCLCLAILLS